MGNIASLVDATQEMDAVVHLAAGLDYSDPYRAFYEDNVLLTKRFLRTSKTSGVELFLYISTAAVAIGSDSPFPLDETALLVDRPVGAYGMTKGLAEHFVLKKNSDQMRVIALRPPFVWAEDSPVFVSIAEAVVKGRFIWVSGGRYVVATVQVQNLAAAICSVLSTREASGVFFVSDGEDVEFCKLVETALDGQGIELPSLSLPAWMARVGAWFAKGEWPFLNISSRPVITNLLIDLIGGEFRISDARARDVLGYRDRISVSDGLTHLRTVPDDTTSQMLERH
jgi:nucleoside-diphosphate-sugar epimerase